MIKEVNIVTLVKRLRHLEIILNNSLLQSDIRKEYVAHTKDNIIEISEYTSIDEAFEGGD